MNQNADFARDTKCLIDEVSLSRLIILRSANIMGLHTKMKHLFGLSAVFALGVMAQTVLANDIQVFHGYVSGDDYKSCIGTFFTRNYPTPQQACAEWIRGSESLYQDRQYCSRPPFVLKTQTFAGMRDGRCIRELAVHACVTPANFSDQCYEWRDYVVDIDAGPYADPLSCPTGYKFSVEAQKCLPVIEKIHDRPSHCPSYGHPIHPLTGAKTLNVPIAGFPAHYRASLYYDTRYLLPGALSPLYEPQVALGEPWSTTFNRRLVFSRDATTGRLYSVVAEGQGQRHSFDYSGGSELDATKSYRLTLRADGSWLLSDLQLNVMHWYTAEGVLRSVTQLYGSGITLQYSTTASPPTVPSVGLLVGVSDVFGRTVPFTYGSFGSNAKTRIASITDPAGHAVQFAYTDAGLLASVTWQDGSLSQFLYEKNGIPWALSGLVDESGKRDRTYGFDDLGRAFSTEMANGADRYSATWDTPPGWSATETVDLQRQLIFREWSWLSPQGASVTGPSGASTAIQSSVVDGFPRITSQTQPGGSGCAASASSQDYDANGNVAWREDFNGHRTCYANDLSRNLETSRVEGLSSGSACDVVLQAGSTLPASARRTSTQWHPVWRLETKLAEPRRLTTKVYNGQPDPFNGGATAYCAPSNGTLPDGSPIVVLCKQVEQATTDANGAQGFAAAVDATVPARVQQWTYDQYGQVLTAKDPLNNTTTSTYYSDTTADHTMGDLATVTNALNQVVARYTKYNPGGQWLEMVDANGVTTTRTFDLRQRLKSVTANSLTTSYDYWPTGLLKAVTLPDASSVSYGYDDAHRLTSVSDSLGNTITYTLDNSGNRIAENVMDPSGKLAKTLTRVPDALNRIQQVSGRD